MRIYKIMLALGLLFTMTASFGGTAKSKPSSDIWDKLVPAWDSTSDKLIDFAGEKKQKMLADLAFAVVVADQCQTLSLDREKFKAEFDSLNDSEYKALSPEEKELYGPTLMSFYGIYVGLLTAESLLERSEFCGYAEDQQAKGEGRFWKVNETDSK